MGPNPKQQQQLLQQVRHYQQQQQQQKQQQEQQQQQDQKQQQQQQQHEEEGKQPPQQQQQQQQPEQQHQQQQQQQQQGRSEVYVQHLSIGLVKGPAGEKLASRAAANSLTHFLQEMLQSRRGETRIKSSSKQPHTLPSGNAAEYREGVEREKLGPLGCCSEAEGRSLK
ncbi:arginyl-tRNA synthetase, putative [Eimeria praecox]|uniref:Arginyl-tRNA synthetase, putative n=1 Tax=Eimeria praecox TaxID=51316 RepID=U6H296_9EIME|nr:arginyl-tRNA synthetase, putative [Eimeria praecox]